MATPRRRNRTSSHVSRVSRGPPRPSPTARPAPNAGPQMRAPGSMRGAGGPAGRRRGGRAWCVRAGARASWDGPWAGLRASRAGLDLEVFYLLFFNGRALPRLSPKGAEAFLGDRGSRQALRACGTTAGRRAAILSPRLLSLWGVGGAESCAITQTAPDVEAAGRPDSGDHRPTRSLGSDGGSHPCQRPEALLKCRGGRCTGTTEILRASASPTLIMLSISSGPFSLQYFALHPAGVLDALVFVLSAELIGWCGEKLYVRFLFFGRGRARDPGGPD